MCEELIKERGVEIAAVAKAGGYDLVFTGKETIDFNGSSIGGMVAELMDVPYVALANRCSSNTPREVLLVNFIGDFL